MSGKRIDLSALDASITRAHRLVSGAMVASLSLYLVWFWVIGSAPLSQRGDDWGQFGDFVGGVLNPLVAYSAFYWLMRSVRLQKEELHETRQALEDSSRSQAKQVEYAHVSVRVSALTALISSIMVEVQTQRMQLQFIVDQSSKHHSGAARLLDGTTKSGTDLSAYIAELNGLIGKRMTERYQYELEIKRLLKQFGDAA